jgi:hypothetical protein
MPDDNFQTIGETLLDATLKPEQRKELLDRLSKMIDYAIKRQDWYEEQRNKTLSLGIALLGLASFLVTGLLNPAIEPMYGFRIFATLTLLAIVGTGSAIILEYVSGASEAYTHRGIADIRSWFFAYVVKEPVLKAVIADENNRERNKQIIVDAWKKFVEGWIEYQNHPMGFVAEDLQQVFILYLFQAMRRRSLRRMIESATIGAFITILCLIMTIIAAGCRI